MLDQQVSTTQIPQEIFSQSQDRLTRGIQISQGLDRLKFGFYVDFDSERLFDILTDAKQEAQEQRSEIPIALGMDSNYFYNCHPHGKSGGYAFRLTRADVSVFISTTHNWMQTPNVLVDIGSASCWSPGYNQVIHYIARLINLFDGKIIKSSVSEVHLCSDFIGLDINAIREIKDENNWIKRANKFHTFSDCFKFSGISMYQSEGTLQLTDKAGNSIETGIVLGIGDIMLRIYDKVFEMKQKGSKQSLFASVWGKEEYDEEPVTRIEFQLRKKVLKQFKIRTLNDLSQKLDGLWQYLTQDWARYCSTRIDRGNRHQGRAEIHEFWKMVQSLSWDTIEPVRRKKPLPQKDKHLLIDMMVGCALNIAAIDMCKHDDIDKISMMLQGEVDTWCRTKASIINPKTGLSELQEKMKQKINEVWPYGYGEVHGPTQKDSENGFITY